MKKMESEQSRYSKVGIGLGMLLASTLVVLLWILALLLLPLASYLGPTLTSILFAILFTFALPILATSSLLMIAGPCLCLATPREARATGWIMLTVALATLNILVYLLPFLGPVSPLLSKAGLLLPFAAQFSLTMFLRKLSQFLRRPDLVSLATSTLSLGAIAVVLAILTRWSPLLAVGVLLFGLLAYLRQLRLLTQLRTAILEKARPAST
jgi:hypothetical protein